VAGFGKSDVGHRCSKTDNKNVKICADSKGTACPLDACRTKCVENKDFECKWYAHDPAKNDCYLYETCTNNEADPDYNAYFLVAADATTAAAGASEGAAGSPPCTMDQVMSIATATDPMAAMAAVPGACGACFSGCVSASNKAACGMACATVATGVSGPADPAALLTQVMEANPEVMACTAGCKDKPGPTGCADLESYLAASGCAGSCDAASAGKLRDALKCAAPETVAPSVAPSKAPTAAPSKPTAMPTTTLAPLAPPSTASTGLSTKVPAIATMSQMSPSASVVVSVGVLLAGLAAATGFS
jgi:hypothetical protein